MKITRAELKKLIAEEVKGTLNEYMAPVNRPANQKKPWGGRTSHQDKPLRWGGDDIAPDKPEKPEPADHGTLGKDRDAERWAQAVYESEYLDKEVFENYSAREVAAIIRDTGYGAMPAAVRLSPAVQQKYEYYYQRQLGELPECDGTGKCGQFGKVVKDMEFSEAVSRDELEKLIAEELKSVLVNQ